MKTRRLGSLSVCALYAISIGLVYLFGAKKTWAQEASANPDPMHPAMVAGTAHIGSTNYPIPQHENPCTIVHRFHPMFDPELIAPGNRAYTHSNITPDINQDGYCDLFQTYFGKQYRSVPSRMWWYNPVNGMFEDESDRLLDNDGFYFSRETKTADLNGDGLYDFISISPPESGPFVVEHDYYYVKSYLSRPDTTWRETTLLSGSIWPADGDTTSGYYLHGLAVGDLDGDGDVDILLANGGGENGKPDLVGYNDGNGAFEFSHVSGAYLSDGRGRSLHLEILDINGDGNLDIINYPWYLIGEIGRPTYIYYGPFTSNLDGGVYQELFESEMDTWVVSDFDFADLDGDGDLDVVVEGLVSVIGDPWPWKFHVFRNDGLGDGGIVNWTDLTIPVNNAIQANGFYSDAASGTWQAFLDIKDMNGDGFLDIVPQRIFLNLSSHNWVIFGTGDLEHWYYPEYILGSTGYWSQVEIVEAKDSGQKVSFVFNSVDDEPGNLWQNISGWLGNYGPAEITLYGSPKAFGDVNYTNLWSSSFTLESLSDPSEFPESILCNGSHPWEYGIDRCSLLRRDIIVPDSVIFLRSQVVNKYGMRSPLSVPFVLDQVKNGSPDAVIISSDLQSPPLRQISFNASASTDPNGDALTFSWDFGDGATGSGETVSHTYTAAGEYTVVLTASDGVLTGTDSLTVSIASGVDTESFELPEGFVLKAAYPNPFNPTTTVTYGLPAAAEVRITATDLLGRQVATLVSGDMKAAGYHTVQFNADGLASGTYLIRMEAGDFVVTQQVVILR